jgi:predicted RNase H-like nuclease (RuvC/YqgF family)
MNEEIKNKAKEIAKSHVFQLVMALIIGIAVGAVFYPSKSIKESLSKEYEAKFAAMTVENSKQKEELQKKVDKLIQENVSIQKDSQAKISSLTQEIKQLKTKKKTVTVKITKPDGTIEERTEEVSETEENSTLIATLKQEYDQKIVQLETKLTTEKTEEIAKLTKEYAAQTTNYQTTISELKKQLDIQINPKKYSIGLGYMSKDSVYVYTDATIFGPVMIGVITQSNFRDSFGLGGGIGIRF